ncbi:hypothetical protein BXZ70DRAFT_568551 [Cristinia sonorae]|uniref:FAD/NAD(P)-binding domain-containing protein n=1 Tax=Cristinia sonorae TaxID=1940300 RepID=A0A8K0UF90_9AGAR|nr:hypothetical protein BXZ70DRAFT_568551 [Cristinia sonorae]
MPDEYLPTSDKLDPPVSEEVDASRVADQWLSSFSGALKVSHVPSVLQTIHPDGWWRDIFALTWDLRSFHGRDKIERFLQDRLTGTLAFEVTSAARDVTLVTEYDDLRWIRFQFTFKTNVAGGRGVAFLVPSRDTNRWEAFVLATHLETLTGHLELIGSLRPFTPNHGKREEASYRKRAYENSEEQPEVVIVGAGHAGLSLAARLGSLGVRTLVIDKNKRVGDNWRIRYDALCLQNAVWANHLPYLHYPPNWPVYIPAKKLANWLEHYVDIMDIDVWTDTLVRTATRDDQSGKWAVTVRDLTTEKEKVVTTDHVVFAIGFGGGKWAPSVPDREKFTGEVLHSADFRSARNYLGKKVVVVGACTSAHDIAADCVEHGVDVTLLQRSSTYIMTTKEGMPRLFKPLYWEGGPPTDAADRIANTLPVRLNKLLWARKTRSIAEADRDLLDALHSVGYETNDGEEGGWLWLAMKRGGGYYLDVGACQMIIDGKIKIKHGIQIERFTPMGVKFDDSTEVQADVLIFATGYGDQRDVMRPIVGDTVADRMPKIWGLNQEGEPNGVWRELGTDGLWYMIGNFAWARFFSKHMALQIKAKQVGLFGTRYPAPVVY